MPTKKNSPRQSLPQLVLIATLLTVFLLAITTAFFFGAMGFIYMSIVGSIKSSPESQRFVATCQQLNTQPITTDAVSLLGGTCVEGCGPEFPLTVAQNGPTDWGWQCQLFSKDGQLFTRLQWYDD